MDYGHLQKEYGGQYIAMVKGRIFAHGRTFKAVLEKARAKGIINSPHLSFRFILPEEGICVYIL
jgi:hypothetical protein